MLDKVRVEYTLLTKVRARDLSLKKKKKKSAWVTQDWSIPEHKNKKIVIHRTDDSIWYFEELSYLVEKVRNIGKTLSRVIKLYKTN